MQELAPRGRDDAAPVARDRDHTRAGACAQVERGQRSPHGRAAAAHAQRREVAEPGQERLDGVERGRLVLARVLALQGFDDDLRARAHVRLERIGAAPEGHGQHRQADEHDAGLVEHGHEGLREREQRSAHEDHDRELQRDDERATRRGGEVGLAALLVR